ncbi:hypothetical protein BRC79_07190 [Halobacteriales archaeon QH_8_67_27]|nr:MAG: hypothetical protein BRC79_07190 [Halobacteriales archaeon QH_8_67_27]
MGDPSERIMLDRRAVSTYGVLFVLAVAVVGATGAPTLAAGESGSTDGPTADGVYHDRSQCPSLGTEGGGSSGDGSTASSHSRESYPDAPHMDVARGDIAAIETGIGRNQAGSVRIESTDGEFNVTLTFANNDGRKPATLYLNTYLAGNESAAADLAYTAGDDDRVAVEERDAVSGSPMPVGAYDVSIETESGTETKRLTVDDPSVDDLTLLRAPGDRFDRLDTDRSITDGRESGVVSDPLLSADGPQAALGDTMVYRLNASGIYGLLAAQGGGSAETNFLEIADDGDVFNLSIRSTGECQASVDVSSSVDSGALDVVPDSTDETLYVTTDLRRVASDADSADSFLGRGRAAYQFEAGSHVTDSDVTTDLEYVVLDREYEYDGDRGVLTRSAASAQPVAGETNLAPGTNLTLNVTEISGDYGTRARATVADDGSFETEVDLSDAPDNERFTLSIAQISNSRTLLTTGDAAETAVWFEEYESPSSDEVTVVDDVRVALEDDGFVAAYAVPPDEQVTHEDLIGRSDSLESGVQDPDVALDETLTDSQVVVLAVHRNTDDDARFDYPADDSPVRTDGETVYAAGRVVLSGDSSVPPRDPRFLSVRLRPADEITGTPVPTATPTATRTDGPVTTTELPPPTLRDDGTETATPGEEGTTAPNGTAVSTADSNGTVGPNGTAAGTDTDDGGPTDELGPGFGPAAVLVAVVLLAVAAVARRP